MGLKFQSCHVGAPAEQGLTPAGRYVAAAAMIRAGLVALDDVGQAGVLGRAWDAIRLWIK